MRRELKVPAQAFRSRKPLAMRTQHDALGELLADCGRFKNPLSLEERLRIRFARALGTLDPLRGAALTRPPEIPLNWQILLRYLHAADVIDEPYFHFDVFPNDAPKAISGWVRAKSDSSGEGELGSYTGGFASAGSLEETLSKAVGETLERHFFRMYKHLDFVQASYEDLVRRSRVLDLSDLNGFLPWQRELFPTMGHDTKTPVRWVQAKNVRTGKKTYVPAQLVFWNYPTGDAADPMSLLNATTSGCAGHFSSDEALLSALLELIERDGFLIYWLNSLSPHVIETDALCGAEFRDLVAYAERYRLKLTFLDTTTDLGIPCATCVVLDNGGSEPSLAIGSAAGFDAEEVLLHAAREALSVYAYVSHLPRFGLPVDFRPLRDASIARNERLRLWRGREMLERFAFFTSGKPRTIQEFTGDADHLVSASDRLDHVLQVLAAKGKGYEVYSYEVRNRVTKRLGYHLVRAIVPQLMPLYLAEHMATLDSKRLREVPEKLGYKKTTGEFNPWPHPFP